MATHCPECKQDVPTYIPKGKDHLHYQRHYTDRTDYAKTVGRDRCSEGGKMVSQSEVMKHLQTSDAAILANAEGNILDPTDPAGPRSLKHLRETGHPLHGTGLHEMVEEHLVSTPTDEELIDRITEAKKQNPDIDAEALSSLVGASLERITSIITERVAELQERLSGLAAAWSPPRTNRAMRRQAKRKGRAPNHAVRVRR